MAHAAVPLRIRQFICKLRETLSVVVGYSRYSKTSSESVFRKNQLEDEALLGTQFGKIVQIDFNNDRLATLEPTLKIHVNQRHEHFRASAFIGREVVFNLRLRAALPDGLKALNRVGQRGVVRFA